jgi:hypothetical protein
VAVRHERRAFRARRNIRELREGLLFVRAEYDGALVCHWILFLPDSRVWAQGMGYTELYTLCSVFVFSWFVGARFARRRSGVRLLLAVVLADRQIASTPRIPRIAGAPSA